MLTTPIGLAERGYLPDFLIRVGIRRLVADRLKLENRRRHGEPNITVAEYADWLRQQEIAVATEKANEQHYEVPPPFFRGCLGKHLKYSCCWFETPSTALDEAEAAMLRLTCERAEIVDGMKILELGCGWGSLSLWMAEHFPASQITAVSNSRPQREYIEAQARERGLTNLRIITADMRDFSIAEKFDRVVSVEMLEHMRNYAIVLERIRSWMHDDAKLFVHIFTHARLAYTFETEGESNWMGQHFFTGGQMPSRDLLSHFADDLTIEKQWEVSGRHYQLTSEAWLKNLDAHYHQLLPLLAEHPSGDPAEVVLQRWRIFYLSCAELFGYRGGNEWGVTHYLFSPTK